MKNRLAKSIKAKRVLLQLKHQKRDRLMVTSFTFTESMKQWIRNVRPMPKSWDITLPDGTKLVGLKTLDAFEDKPAGVEWFPQDSIRKVTVEANDVHPDLPVCIIEHTVEFNYSPMTGLPMGVSIVDEPSDRIPNAPYVKAIQ